MNILKKDIKNFTGNMKIIITENQYNSLLKILPPLLKRRINEEEMNIILQYVFSEVRHHLRPYYKDNFDVNIFWKGEDNKIIRGVISLELLSLGIDSELNKDVCDTMDLLQLPFCKGWILSNISSVTLKELGTHRLFMFFTKEMIINNKNCGNLEIFKEDTILNTTIELVADMTINL